jgi:hypothetical protein
VCVCACVRVRVCACACACSAVYVRGILSAKVRERLARVDPARVFVFEDKHGESLEAVTRAHLTAVAKVF